MTTLFYLVAITIVYVVLSERMDRAVQRTFQSRGPKPPLRLMEEFDTRPTPDARTPRGTARAREAPRRSRGACPDELAVLFLER